MLPFSTLFTVASFPLKMVLIFLLKSSHCTNLNFCVWSFWSLMVPSSTWKSTQKHDLHYPVIQQVDFWQSVIAPNHSAKCQTAKRQLVKKGGIMFTCRLFLISSNVVGNWNMPPPTSQCMHQFFLSNCHSAKFHNTGTRPRSGHCQPSLYTGSPKNNLLIGILSG